MTKGLVTVVIPSRNEQFLVKTVVDLLAKAAGPVEIIVCLDGYWEHGLPADPRVKILHFGEAHGMRPAINAAVQMSTGEFLMKCDAHCMFDEGVDVKLRADYLEDNWVLVPRRYPLDPENWKIQERTDHKYPIDQHFLSEPFERHGDSNPGFHGSEHKARRDAIKGDLIEDLSSQGSCWFMSRKHWDRTLEPLDAASYGSFVHEFQEVGLKTQLSGGAVMVSRRTNYCHLWKGKRGRGYNLRGLGHEQGTLFCTWFWGTDQPFKGRIHTLQWLIEKFSQQMAVPTWPADIGEHFARMRREFRNPYAVAA